MSAELVVHPGHEVPGMDAFVTGYPPYSIAADGYVIGGPESRMTADGPYVNFDHHSDANRLATLSTAQQVLRAIRLGLVDAFTREGVYHPTLYVNDCDQDISLAWYFVQHAQDIAERTTLKAARRLRNLADMQGDLDATAGAYPYNPRLPLMENIAWMFRPYTEFRQGGDLQQMQPEQYHNVIVQCAGRIALYLEGRGQRERLDTRNEVLYQGDGWSMFREIGPEGRIGAFSSGIKAYVIYKGQRPNGGRHDYSIGRASEYVPFDVEGIVRELNLIEGCPPGGMWGCARTGITGGSPRLEGSRLAPQTLFEIINEYQHLLRNG